MESHQCSNHGYWEVRESKNYAFLCCPIMEGMLTFKEMRLIYQQYKILERVLKVKGVGEIVGYTSIYNPHIMKMFIKLGFSPFYLSLKKNILWFKKETQNV